MQNRFTRSIALLLSLCVLNFSFVQSASAAVIGTGDAIAAATRADQLSSITAVLARADVQAALEAHGVSVEDAMDRVANLSDEELMVVQQQFDQLPAGGTSFFAVLGITFLVLLILELTGVINIFSKF
jgi:pyridoxal/pyridoxine/pyridoxamine kinase